MIPQIELLPGAVYDIMASASETGRLNLCDRYGLMAATLDDSLSEEERRAIDRLLRFVIRGRFQVDNEI
ncbi:hypothetical protein [Geitlerinema sp. PCC 9228]|jgi:hypothetical protein|uniref:hypothetical protein n=1 Tax=Geitlerinema sp. PCC 9228 TaxID=111611 RepID=UPI0008F98C0D|nr:hypothetical protein [Geitlerinema sp. PCC 9228]